MRRGKLPAKKTSIAERGELGSTSGEIKFFSAQLSRNGKNISPGANEIDLVNRRMIHPQVAQFFRAEQGDVRAGNFSRSRSSAGVVIIASPIQFVREPGFSSETDFADAILKVVRAADDLNFHAHEKKSADRAGQFSESAPRPFACDDDLRLAFFPRLMAFKNLLLCEAVMVGEALE